MNCSTDKISIIVPVYNVEPYIRRCLDSIINQTYKNLEILLINDGSTDNSGMICDEYAEKDNRIKVFHKSNGGLSSALNVGLRNLSGDYLGFIDSDDWAEEDMFEVLYNSAKQYNVPLSVATYFTNTDLDESIVINRDTIPDGVLSTRDILLYSLKRDSYTGFCGYVWNKLYSVDMVKDSNVYFDDNIRYGMDALFFTNLAIKSDFTGVFTNMPLYHYNIRESSMTNYNPIENSGFVFAAYISVIQLLDESKYNDISKWAKRFYCYYASVYAEIAIKNNDCKILAEMQDEIKRYLNVYISTNKEFPDRLERINSILKLK